MGSELALLDYALGLILAMEVIFATFPCHVRLTQYSKGNIKCLILECNVCAGRRRVKDGESRLMDPA